MKLFLASAAANCLLDLSRIFKINPTNTLVAFIPTAGELYENPLFVENDRKRLVELGYRVKNISLIGQNSDSLREQLKDCQAIFVAGGNTFYLLQESNKSGFTEIIRELVDNDIIYIGSSAGSCIAGPTLEPIVIIDEVKAAPDLENYDSFSLIDEIILPHFDHASEKEANDKIINEFGKKYKIIPLTDSQSYVVDGLRRFVIDVDK